MATIPRQTLPKDMREQLAAHPEATIAESEFFYRKARGIDGFVACDAAGDLLVIYDDDGREALNIAR